MKNPLYHTLFVLFFTFLYACNHKETNFNNRQTNKNIVDSLIINYVLHTKPQMFSSAEISAIKKSISEIDTLSMIEKLSFLPNNTLTHQNQNLLNYLGEKNIIQDIKYMDEIYYLYNHNGILVIKYNEVSDTITCYYKYRNLVNNEVLKKDIKLTKEEWLNFIGLVGDSYFWYLSSDLNNWQFIRQKSLSNNAIPFYIEGAYYNEKITYNEKNNLIKYNIVGFQNSKPQAVMRDIFLFFDKKRNSIITE